MTKLSAFAQALKNYTADPKPETAHAVYDLCSTVDLQETNADNQNALHLLAQTPDLADLPTAFAHWQLEYSPETKAPLQDKFNALATHAQFQNELQHKSLEQIREHPLKISFFTALFHPTIENSPLQMALQNGNEPFIRLCLSQLPVTLFDFKWMMEVLHAYCPNFRTILPTLINAVVESTDPEQLQEYLHAMCKRGYHLPAILLINHGVDITARDAQGRIPLMSFFTSAEKNNAYLRQITASNPDELVRLVDSLVGSGELVNARDKVGQTALHIGCSGSFVGSVSCMVRLLLKNAQVNLIDLQGKNPVMILLDRPNCSIHLLEKLMEGMSQEEVNLPDPADNNNTLLHKVCREAKDEVLATMPEEDFAKMRRDKLDKIRVLMRNGASILALNSQDETPLQIAKRKSDWDDVVKVLQKATSATDLSYISYRSGGESYGDRSRGESYGDRSRGESYGDRSRGSTPGFDVSAISSEDNENRTADTSGDTTRDSAEIAGKLAELGDSADAVLAAVSDVQSEQRSPGGSLEGSREQSPRTSHGGPKSASSSPTGTRDLENALRTLHAHTEKQTLNHSEIVLAFAQMEEMEGELSQLRNEIDQKEQALEKLEAQLKQREEYLIVYEKNLQARADEEHAKLLAAAQEVDDARAILREKFADLKQQQTNLRDVFAAGYEIFEQLTNKLRQTTTMAVKGLKETLHRNQEKVIFLQRQVEELEPRIADYEIKEREQTIAESLLHQKIGEQVRKIDSLIVEIELFKAAQLTLQAQITTQGQELIHAREKLQLLEQAELKQKPHQENATQTSYSSEEQTQHAEEDVEEIQSQRTQEDVDELQSQHAEENVEELQSQHAQENVEELQSQHAEEDLEELQSQHAEEDLEEIQSLRVQIAAFQLQVQQLQDQLHQEQSKPQPVVHPNKNRVAQLQHELDRLHDQHRAIAYKNRNSALIITGALLIILGLNIWLLTITAGLLLAVTATIAALSFLGALYNMVQCRYHHRQIHSPGKVATPEFLVDAPSAELQDQSQLAIPLKTQEKWSYNAGGRYGLHRDSGVKQASGVESVVTEDSHASAVPAGM